MQLNHFKRIRQNLYSILCLILLVTGGFIFHLNVASAAASSTWTLRTSGTTTILDDVAYNGSYYLAVGDGGILLRSTDGANWTLTNLTDSGTSIVWTGSLWVIACQSGAILTSPNGTTWTPSSTGNTNELHSIVYNGSTLVAVGEFGTILTSTNGTSWTNHSVNLNPPAFWGVTYGNGLFVATGSDGALYTSPNGNTWTQQISRIERTGLTLYQGVFANNQFVVPGDGGTIIHSGDGVSWAQVTSSTGNNLYAVAYGAGKYVAVGSVGTVVSSTDGFTWTAENSGESSDDFYNVIYGSSKFVAVGTTGLMATQSQNTDATLSNLTLSAGTLSPTFAPATTSYTASVDYSKTSVNVTPTLTDSNASVTVNGQSASSGQATSVNLAVGDNVIPIVVTAQDGTTQETYNVTVTRTVNAATPTIDTQPADATVNQGEAATLSIHASVTDGGSLSYQWYSNTTNSNSGGNAIIGATNATFTPSTGSVGTTYYYCVVTNTNNNVTGSQTATTSSNVATVTVNASPLSNDANLSNLTLSAGSLSPSFASGTTGYTASVANGVASVDVTPTIADSNATVTISVDNGNAVTGNGNAYTVPLNVGTNTITVVVTAQDGTTTKTYTIAVDRAAALSSNADFTFTTGPAVVPYTVTSEDITVTPSDNTASVTINGQPVTNGQAKTVNLNVGVNTITIVVTAQDGITKKTGQVNITRQAPSTNAELNNLSVDTGTLNPSFSPSNMDYTVDVPNTTASVNVTPTLADGTATIVVDGNPATSGQSSSISLSNTTTTVPIVVTAQDGITTKTYTITINKVMTDAEAVTADKSTLAIGYASGDSASSVTQNVYLPTSGPNGTTIVWTSTDSSITPDGTVTRPSYNAGDKTVTLTATLTKGTVIDSQPFTLTVRKESVSSNTALSTLSLSGGITLNETVSSNVYAYTANIGNSVTSTTISATPVDSNATVSYQLNGNPVNNPINLSVGSNEITVVITAQDGVTKQDYTVSLNRDANGNADLSNIRINGNLLSNFSPTVTEYTYQVPNNVTDVTVTGSTADPTATVQITGGHSLIVGSNPVTLDVTAQNNTTKQYILNIIRAGSSNTQLSSLSTNVGELTPSFNGATYLYSISLPNSVDAMSITASVYDPNATIRVNGTPITNGQASGLIPLQAGNNAIQVLVTAQDGTQGSYSISANRASSSVADLSGLLLNQGTLSPSFDPGTSTYSVEVPYETDSLSVTASVYDPNATIQMNGVSVASGTASNPIALQIGSNAIQVVVVAQDGVTTKTYSLNVTRDGNIGGGSSSSSSSSYGTPIAVTITNSDGSHGTIPPSVLKMLGAEQASITVLNTDGTRGPTLSISPDGQVHLQINVASGSYPVSINVTAPNGESLAIISGTLTVDSNGASTLALIDPYGVITDSVTKQKISGVHVQLYWADTELNRSKGRTPDTVVTLPELPNFDPNKNLNPQISTMDGRYGWMVFPDGDYYVIAQKDGYQTYDSRKDTRDEQQGDTSYIRNGLIHVGKTIVHMDFSMNQNQVVNEGSQQEGYIKGYPDGTFRPEKQVTRAELASILARVLPVSDAETKNDFSDVSTNHWAIQSIEKVAGSKVMSGYPDGTFHPDSPITRAEMASIVARVKHLDAKTPATFKDTTNHWASISIGAVQIAGFISGYPDGTFHPDQPLTRAEGVSIVNRMIGKTGSQNPSQTSWKDVPSSYWAYDQIEEASK